MKIRTSLAINILPLSTLFFFNPQEANSQESEDPKPNIIFIIADDIDKNQLSCFGGDVYSPNIDNMALEGMIFNHAYVSSTVCTPSRYSLTTGRYAGRSLYSPYLDKYPLDSQGHPEFNIGLEHDYMNVGKVLKDNGYKTGWVGKFHIGEDESLIGLTDEEETFLKTATADDPRSSELFSKLEKAYEAYILNKGFSWAKTIYPGNIDDPFAWHNLEWNIEAALEFIEMNKDNPFYLHFNTTLLHGPDGSWENSLAYPQVTGEGIIDRELQAGMPPRETISERVTENGYANALGITWLDDGVGAILNKLDSLNLTDNTIVVFLPDHGSSNKASLYSFDGTNIPMIIKYPKEIDSSSVCNSLVQGIDLVPTFFDLTGINPPENYIIDGASLRPLFQNPEETIHESLFFELGCARAVMTKEYKYIATRYTQDRIDDILKIEDENLKELILKKLIILDGHFGISSRGIKYNPDYLSPDQIYDLKIDPTEKNNLAKDPLYQDKLDEMKILLTDYLLIFEHRPFGEFIPGSNASAPNPIIEKYIENIIEAFNNGATIVDDALVCDGNCVLDSPSTSSFQDSEFKTFFIKDNFSTIQIEPKHEFLQMRLHDINGRIISTSKNNGSDIFIIEKTSLTPGIYFISMIAENFIETEKIIIRK